MKKLVLWAAVLAMMMLLVAAPVLAEHRNRFDDQELRSGDIEFDTDISIRGNNNNQCAGVLQFGNTGNFSNQQGSSQYDNPHFEHEFEGPEFDFSPENETECNQRVQQSAAASSWWGWWDDGKKWHDGKKWK
ncbi:MAG TPA: hypothetical protein VHF46_00385 [Rubrobacteraceae bacterium]|nr:hypothetical protein [Rubrobacteraceae bacterium]